ncbi:HmuY family protein [Alkanindiges sp. WGS2144]|uniref:HmuY family protein n=1 Tax=Alkanindiges sp. WGS2144 TaxID=3366808 RepID=UPI00374FE154
MRYFNQTSLKCIAVSALSVALAACGGSGSSDSGNNSNGDNSPPASIDAFSVKAKQWIVPFQANTDACYDIDTQAQVDCNKPDWDLKFAAGARTASFYTNSGASATAGDAKGGALGSPFDYTWNELQQQKDATQGGSIPNAAWLTDSYQNAFSSTDSAKFNAFFEYDLFGTHQMSPNFKVFLITTDNTSKATIGTDEAPVYALQITNYYQGTTSGYMEIRYIDTRNPEDVRTATVDARNGWVYFDLKNKTRIDVPKDSNWQVAFNRYNIKLNNGTVGTSGKVGSYTDDTLQPTGFYDADGKVMTSKFQSKTVLNDTLQDLKNATTVQVNQWTSDSIASILNPGYQGQYPSPLDYGWFKYYPTANPEAGVQAAHTLVANPENASLIRGNTGKSYARFHVTNIEYADPKDINSAQKWTIEFDIQPAK